MLPEDPSFFSVMQPVPVVPVGEIGQRTATRDQRLPVLAIGETGLNDTFKRIKPGINIVVPVFQYLNLPPRYKKADIFEPN